MKKIVSLFLSLALFLSLTSAFLLVSFADENELIDEQGIIYIPFAGNYAVSGFTESAVDVVIPETVNGKPVTTIVNFRNAVNLKSVVIPNSVTRIENHAFTRCPALESVTLPQSLEIIGEGAFGDCQNLKDITIPDSVVTVGEHAFAQCTSLETLTLGKSVSFIGEGAFLRTNLKTVTLSEENEFFTLKDGCLIENSTKTLLFTTADCKIPSDIKKINGSALTNYKANEKLVIPEDAFIGENIFSEEFFYAKRTEYKNVYYYGTNENPYQIAYMVADETLATYTIHPKTKQIAGCAFYECYNLTDINIPESVVSIGNSAFFSNNALTSITIPDSVTQIGDLAFGNCRFETINIPNSVVYIGKGAFAFCTKLTEIVLPQALTSIEESTFVGCETLSGVTIPKTVTNIGDYAFSKCSALIEIVIPKSVEVIGESAFDGCSNLKDIYCEAESLPEGWAVANPDDDELGWTGKIDAIVHWNSAAGEPPVDNDPEGDASEDGSSSESEGEDVIVETISSETPEGENEEKSNLILWIVIAVVGIAGGAIVIVTVMKNNENKKRNTWHQIG